MMGVGRGWAQRVRLLGRVVVVGKAFSWRSVLRGLDALAGVGRTSGIVRSGVDSLRLVPGLHDDESNS